MRELAADRRPLVVSGQGSVLTFVKFRLQFRQHHIARHLLLDLLLMYASLSLSIS